MPLVEGSLRLWSVEQGLGDAIQFCRYLNLLDVAGIPFVFLTRPSLISLMRDWTGLVIAFNPLIVLIPRPIPGLMALMSLPRLFGTEPFGSLNRPYLHASAPPHDDLCVVNPPGGISVGLVWASNPTNKAMYRSKTSLWLFLCHFLNG